MLMSFNERGESMKENRIEKTLELMKKNGLDGLLYASSANFQYLADTTDYFWQRTSMNNIAGKFSAENVPEALYFLNDKGESFICCIPSLKNEFPGFQNLYLSYVDQMEDTISLFIRGKRIGIGFNCMAFIKETLLAIDPMIEIVDAEEILNDLRTIKDKDEIKALRDIASFTDKAVKYVCDNLKEGMTQREIEQLLMDYGFNNNIPDFAFSPTCGLKTRNTPLAKDALTFSRDSVLVEGTAIAFDVGYVQHGYCSDWGRTVYFGKAPELVKNGYKALQAGQQYMVANIIPYKTNNNELYDLVLKKVTEMGYGDYLRFQDIGMLGHQIGIDCHEHPMINRATDYILKPGMVFCSEPKMFFVDECYMRVEDMILVTETGAEFLTKFDRDLFELT
jgi:Xaa-Pro dipeptidase